MDSAVVDDDPALPGAPSSTDAPPPQSRHERWIQVACGVGLLLQTVRYYATLPLLGYLLTRPLRYLSIHPSTLALVIGGAYARDGRDPAWAVVVLGVLSLALVDPLRWLAGHRYGDRVALLLLGNNIGLVRRVERFSARWGTWGLVVSWFTPLPVVLIQLAAATGGMSLRRYLLADLAGVALWVLTIAGLGYGIGSPAVHVVKRVGHYSLEVTIAAVVLGVLFGVRQQMRTQRRG